jgi:hypothetical protein
MNGANDESKEVGATSTGVSHQTPSVSNPESSEESASPRFVERLDSLPWWIKLPGPLLLAVIANLLARYLDDWIAGEAFRGYGGLIRLFQTGFILLSGLLVFVVLSALPHEFRDRPFRFDFLNSLLGGGLVGVVVGGLLSWVGLLPVWPVRTVGQLFGFDVLNYEILIVGLMSVWLGYFVVKQSDILTLTIHTFTLSLTGSVVALNSQPDTLDFPATLSGWYATCAVAAALWLLLFSRPVRAALKPIWTYLTRHR